jgi:hypothetical protein
MRVGLYKIGSIEAVKLAMPAAETEKRACSATVRGSPEIGERQLYPYDARFSAQILRRTVWAPPSLIGIMRGRDALVDSAGSTQKVSHLCKSYTWL